MPQTRHYEMKDSGVEWIGEMPSHWNTLRLQKIYRIKKDIAGTAGYTVLSVTQHGIKPKNMDSKGQFALDYSKYQLVKSGDFVMNHMDLLTGWVDISKYDGVTSPDYRVFTSIANCQNTFFKYIFQFCYMNRVFYGLGQGVADVGRWRLPADMFRKFMLPVPPLPEQAAIAAYLDEKCATIDAIIAEAKASIEEYKSWKASVIFETVTKGLNPNAEMKDSGVEWIGEIPKAWQYTPLKYLASCNDEVLTEATPEDYTFDYIDIGSVHTGNGIGICERMQFKDAPSRARRIVRDGDIIVSTVRTYLKAIAQVGNYDVPHIASTGFAVIRTKNANASFLRYALLSDNFVSQVEADSVGISYPAINASQIMAFKIPVPSIAEQVAIASYLDARCAAIDGVIAEKEALIGELETYKRSLIFEVVTGKRRVC